MTNFLIFTKFNLSLRNPINLGPFLKNQSKIVTNKEIIMTLIKDNPIKISSDFSKVTSRSSNMFPKSENVIVDPSKILAYPFRKYSIMINLLEKENHSILEECKEKKKTYYNFSRKTHSKWN